MVNEMTHDTLQEMGIHFGDRVRILRAVETLKAAPAQVRQMLCGMTWSATPN